MLGSMLDTKNRLMNETQFLPSVTEERKMYSTFVVQYRHMYNSRSMAKYRSKHASARG